MGVPGSWQALSKSGRSRMASQKFLHRLAHKLRPFMIRRHTRQLLQDQPPLVQCLHWQDALRQCLAGQRVSLGVDSVPSL